METALLLPLFLFIILGVLEVGRYWWIQQAMAGAVREGARRLTAMNIGCPPSDPEAATEVVRSALTLGGIDGAAPDTTIETKAVIDPEYFGAGGVPITRMELRVTHEFDSLLPVLPGLLSGTSSQSGRLRLVSVSLTECEPARNLSK
ncbi:MAG: TadE/TadG family type IV pilus assembly protein [Blastocatellia bacterium]